MEPQTFQQNPNDYAQTPPKKSKKIVLLILLAIVLVAAAIGGVWWLQQKKINNANAEIKTLQAQNTELQTKNNQEAQQVEEQEDLNAEEAISESDAQQIQRVATAWRNRLAGGTNTDTSSFTTEEPTIIRDSFAIQNYCGPSPSGCSQMWLKKVGNTWLVIGMGQSLDGSNLPTLSEEYGWPADFTR